MIKFLAIFGQGKLTIGIGVYKDKHPYITIKDLPDSYTIGEIVPSDIDLESENLVVLHFQNEESLQVLKDQLLEVEKLFKSIKDGTYKDNSKTDLKPN